ncbi:MAG: hypothetical protein KDB03_03175 [Planctomycetales bacterium]|nr:hypothetical protein [Planctomycetales bacterium]
MDLSKHEQSELADFGFPVLHLFIEATCLPSGVLGPVAFSHGLILPIAIRNARLPSSVIGPLNARFLFPAATLLGFFMGCFELI